MPRARWPIATNRNQHFKEKTMVRKGVWIAIIAGVVTACGFGVRAHAAGDTLQAGATAPDFSLPSQEDTAVSLSQYKGKGGVLYFYPKDMTAGCTIEAHNFQQDIAKYQQLDAVVVGVSVDSTDSHKEVCAKEGLSFKLLSDQDKKVVAQYGSMADYMGVKIAKRNTFLIYPK